MYKHAALVGLASTFCNSNGKDVTTISVEQAEERTNKSLVNTDKTYKRRFVAIIVALFSDLARHF